MRKFAFLLGIVSTLVGLGTFLWGYREYERLIATTSVVVPKVKIPPYTIIKGEFLERKEVPRPIREERIYSEEEEVIGKIAKVPLSPGMLIYRDFVVSQSAFRFVEDPSLEVVSFPVSPERACGGQIRRGHLINIYRGGASVEKIAEGVLVVDVRSQRGERAGEVEEARLGVVAKRVLPLQIITVAVSPSVAREIILLAASEDVLWVSLAPVR
jgi:hypothetical protein